MNPLISIVVPIYRVEDYLEQCIKSLINQTYKNLEIILVDDGSPDNCPKICDEWEKRDNRIKVIHKKNGGLSDARNAGIAVATGEYIAFLDSDDWVDIRFYDTLYSQLVKYNCDIASAGYIATSDRNAVINNKSSENVEVLSSYEALYELIDDNKVKQVVWNKLYKRELIDGVFFAVGKYHEDEFWSYQIIGKSNKIAVCDYKGLFYYQRPDSIMGVGFSHKRLDALEAKLLRVHYLREHYPTLVDRGIVSVYCTCVYLGQCALVTKDVELKEIFDKFKGCIKNNPVNLFRVKNIDFKQKIWLSMARISLKTTCRIRNKLKIGF